MDKTADGGYGSRGTATSRRLPCERRSRWPLLVPREAAEAVHIDLPVARRGLGTGTGVGAAYSAGWSSHCPALQASQPCRDSVPNLVGRVLLKEMLAPYGHLLLVEPGAAKLALLSGQDRPRLSVDE